MAAAARQPRAVAQRPRLGRRDADPGARDVVRHRQLTFVTRAGVAVPPTRRRHRDALLVAFSVVALVAAATMLAAAHAEVRFQRSACSAVGFTPGRIAAPRRSSWSRRAAALGLTVGALAVARPADALLAALNEMARAQRCCRCWPRARGGGGDRAAAATWPGARPRGGRRRRSCAAEMSPAALEYRGPWLASSAPASRPPAGRADRDRGDRRRLRGDRDADARARVAVDACATTGNGRQALPGHGAAAVVDDRQRAATARRGGGRRATGRRGRHLARRAAGTVASRHHTRFERRRWPGASLRGPARPRKRRPGRRFGLRPGSTPAAQLASGSEVRFRERHRARVGERRPDRGCGPTGCWPPTPTSARASRSG